MSEEKDEDDEEHCSASPDGEHEADPVSAEQAADCDFVIDLWCKFCGQSGSVTIDPKEIQW